MLRTVQTTQIMCLELVSHAAQKSVTVQAEHCALDTFQHRVLGILYAALLCKVSP